MTATSSPPARPTPPTSGAQAKEIEVLDRQREAAPARPGLQATSLDTKSKLSLLWIFYMFNTAYIDITTLYYSMFINHKPKVHYTQVFLLGAGVLVELSIVMVVLSRLLKYRANRRANIIVGLFLTVVQLVTLFVGTPTLAYLFFSVILIATSMVIVWAAWKWLDGSSSRPMVHPVPGAANEELLVRNAKMEQADRVRFEWTVGAGE